MATGLYESYDLAALKALRDKILAKRAENVLSFTFNGQAFTYTSPGQMKVVADEIHREVRRREASAKGLVPVRLGPMTFSRPLSE